MCASQPRVTAQPAATLARPVQPWALRLGRRNPPSAYTHMLDTQSFACVRRGLQQHQSPLSPDQLAWRTTRPLLRVCATGIEKDGKRMKEAGRASKLLAAGLVQSSARASRPEAFLEPDFLPLGPALPEEQGFRAKCCGVMTASELMPRGR